MDHQYNLLAIASMMMMMACHTTAHDSNAILRIKPTHATPAIEEIVRFTNSTLLLNCSGDGISSHLVTWAKDGVRLTNKNNKIMIDENGRLQLVLLDKKLDSGLYTCMTNRTNQRRFHLKVMTEPRMSIPFEAGHSEAANNKLSVLPYSSLPDWMTGVACVVLIAMVTIVIIVAYVKIATPKKGDLRKRFETPNEEQDIEVIAKGDDKRGKEKELAVIRQRRSTSSQETSFHNEVPKDSSSRKDNKSNERDLGNGELPTKASSRGANSSVEKDEKIKSGPCHVISGEEKDFASFFTHHSMMKEMSKCQEKKPAPFKVRSEPELIRKTPESSNRLKEFRPKTSEKTRSSGKKLRKVASEPYCVSAKSAVKSNSKIAEGQALNKVSSDCARRPADTIYSGPVIVPGLAYEKHAIYAKAQKKLKKAKSENAINKSTKVVHGDMHTKKSKCSRSEEAGHQQSMDLNFSNPFYASIEDINVTTSAMQAQQCLDREDDDDEPVYRDINNFIDVSFKKPGNKCENIVQIVDIANLKSEKQIENIGFSFSEDIEDLNDGFDGQPVVSDKIYGNVGTIDTNHPITCVRELPKLPSESADEENVYEELYCSKA